MALDDADRLRLAEIERQLEQENPVLARTLRREPVQLPRLPAVPVVPVVGAVVVLLVSFGWLSVQGGNPLPLLLAAVPAAVTLLTLRWQRSRPGSPDRPPAPGAAAPEQPRDAPPPWWVT